MIRKIAIAVFIVLLVLAALGGVKTLQVKKLIAVGESSIQPPESVSSVVVREETWQDTLSAIGSVTAAQGVTVTPEMPGVVREIAFESGAVVSQGDLLIRLNTSSEEAQLRAVEAQVQLAGINLERMRKLSGEHVGSQSDLDTAEATMKQNRANADAIRSTIEQKTIRAPFSGRLGIRQVNLGQYLDISAPIVSLQSLGPVHAEFSLPQQQLARLNTGMRVRLTSDAYPDRRFEGTLTAINPDLNQSTRSVGLQATFDNPDQLLRPGMFARVEVLLPEEEHVLVIPATSVVSAPYGDSVFLIEARPGGDGNAGPTVRQQFIRTGRARGDFLSVKSGVKPGDRIVSSGVFKLRNGMSVVENSELEPTSAEAPLPPDS